MPVRKKRIQHPKRRKTVSRKRPTVGGSFEDLVRLQARLLTPGGCPWDREQTHESLRTYLLEEAYEVLEAIESRDAAKLREELGDLLLQVVFHAALAEKAGRFDIRGVAQGIHDKMVRRHPHVFGDAAADTSGQVLKNWEHLKAEERRAAGKKPADGGGDSLLDGVPHTLPALLEGYQLTRRAARIGFDWDDLAGVLDKVREELEEVRTAAGAKRIEEEVGDLLFVTVNVARFLHIDPEIALKKANRKFTERFRQMEAAMHRRGSKLADASREEMEELWERSKALGR